MTKEKESLPKCPQCGATETRVESRVVGGLIAQQVRKDGTVGPSGGAKQTITVYCAECGVELNDHPDQVPDVIKEMKKDLENIKLKRGIK